MKMVRQIASLVVLASLGASLVGMKNEEWVGVKGVMRTTWNNAQVVERVSDLRVGDKLILEGTFHRSYVVSTAPDSVTVMYLGKPKSIKQDALSFIRKATEKQVSVAEAKFKAGAKMTNEEWAAVKEATRKTWNDAQVVERVSDLQEGDKLILEGTFHRSYVVSTVPDSVTVMYLGKPKTIKLGFLSFIRKATEKQIKDAEAKFKAAPTPTKPTPTPTKPKPTPTTPTPTAQVASDGLPMKVTEVKSNTPSTGLTTLVLRPIGG